MDTEKKQKNKIVSFIIDGILSGFTLGVGGMVSLSSDNKYIGALYNLSMDCLPVRSAIL